MILDSIVKIGRTVALTTVLVGCLGVHSSARAQSAHRQRRESTANRKARVARTVAETYGHRWEVGGGGGYLRFRTGEFQRQANEVTFWVSTMYAINPKFGVQAEVRGAYGTAQVGNLTTFLPYNPKVSEYAFMAGPSYRFLKREKYSISGFAEAGAGLGKFAGDSKGFSARDIGVWTGDYAAAFTVGANLDYNLYPNLALRLTPTYLGTTFGGTIQNSKGINAGLVYRFGKR